MFIKKNKTQQLSVTFQGFSCEHGPARAETTGRISWKQIQAKFDQNHK